MANFAEIHGYIATNLDSDPSSLLDELWLMDPDIFRVKGSASSEAFQRRYISFAGQARISGATDDRSWMQEIESRLPHHDFFCLVIYVAYEDAPTLSYSYFKSDGITRLITQIAETTLSEKAI